MDAELDFAPVGIGQANADVVVRFVWRALEACMQSSICFGWNRASKRGRGIAIGGVRRSRVCRASFAPVRIAPANADVEVEVLPVLDGENDDFIRNCLDFQDYIKGEWRERNLWRGHRQ